jgi:hypothetical protein
VAAAAAAAVAVAVESGGKVQTVGGEGGGSGNGGRRRGRWHKGRENGAMVGEDGYVRGRMEGVERKQRRGV